METEQKKPFIIDFVNNNLDKIKIVETVSIIILFVGLILHFLKVSNIDFITIIGSVLLAISFFLQSFKISEYNEIEKEEKSNTKGIVQFVNKLIYMSLAIASVAIIGLVSNFRSLQLVIIAGGTLIICLILIIFNKIENKFKIFPISLMLKIVIAILILSYIYLLKKGQL